MSSDDRPKGRRLRTLSEDEIDLWLSVAESIVRRPGATLPVRFAEPPAPALAPKAALPVRPFLPPYIAKPKPAVIAMAPLERKTRQKLARGRLSADAAIDLHGFRQAEAHSALRHFLYQAQRDGARIVLVVTGKGGRGQGLGADPFDIAGGSIGILKRSVPLWLAQPDLRPIVVGFEEAARPHGGSGALYVRLRRKADPPA